MTHHHGTAPVKEADYLGWAHNIIQTATDNATAWSLQAGLLAQLKTTLQTAQTAWEHNNNPTLKNHATVTAKNAALARLKSELSLFIDLLESNTRVPDEALAAMNLRPRHPGAHQPKPAPEEAPVLTILTGQHHDITAYVSTLQHGHPTEYLNRGNYYGFLLKYQFEGETEVHQLVSTRKHRTLVFDESKEGRYIKLSAAWVNARIEPGPWSEEVRELVN
jgi:hypothetical protein